MHQIDLGIDCCYLNSWMYQNGRRVELADVAIKTTVKKEAVSPPKSEPKKKEEPKEKEKAKAKEESESEEEEDESEEEESDSESEGMIIYA